MRIDKACTAAPARSSTKARRLQSGFAVPPDDDGVAASGAPEPAHAAVEAAPAASVSLSDVAPAAALDSAANQKAAGHASAVLGAMGGLQLALLEGASTTARQSLSDLAAALPSAPDPALDAVLQEIAQRAAIELAKPCKQGSK